MKTHFLSATIPRRAFLQYSADLAALAAIGPLANSATTSAAEPPPDRKTIGIQVGSVSFVDEGTEQVLDLLQERGAIDTIYLTTFTYGRGLAGRQIPGQPVSRPRRAGIGRETSSTAATTPRRIPSSIATRC